MRTGLPTRRIAGLWLLAVLGCGDGSGPAGGGRGGSGGGTSGRGGATAGTGGSSSAGTSGGGTGGSMTGGRGGRAGTGGSAGAAGSAGSPAGGAGGRGGVAAGSGGASAGAGGATGGAAGGAAGVGGGGAGRGGIGGSTAGASGSAGSAAGAGGRGGGGATAGTGGAPTSGLKLEYSTASASATNFDVRITNLGPGTTLIAAIKFRYYFRDESAGATTTLVDLARWTVSNPPAMIDLRSSGCSVNSSIRPATMPSYTDIGCNLASPLGVNDFLSFTVHDSATQDPTNDYSDLATGGTLTPNDHMLLLVNGVVVSGTAP